LRFLQSSATCCSPGWRRGCLAERSSRLAKEIDDNAEDEDGDPAPQQQGENGVGSGRIGDNSITIG
jgi:hypothetical protein